MGKNLFVKLFGKEMEANKQFMDGGVDKMGMPTGKDATGDFSIVTMMGKEYKMYTRVNKVDRTPEEEERIKVARAARVEAARLKKEPFTKATEMGFTLQEDRETNLFYKGEEVAHDVMASWYADDDDYNYYDSCVVYVKGTNVGVRGTLCEVGADRPGMSYRGKYAYVIGTLDGDKFVKKDHESRDMTFEKYD